MAQRFVDIDAPAHLASLWFARLLRDGFALSAAGTAERFTVIGEQVLRGMLADVPINRGLDAAVDHVKGGFLDLPVHPDVPSGVRALSEAGLRLITLTNGSTHIAERLLTAADLRERFEALLTVDDADVWKPARGAYHYAARRCGAEPADMLLVAVHPWDIEGAARAGMATAWINRTGGAYAAHFTAPQHTCRTLGELAQQLAPAS